MVESKLSKVERMRTSHQICCAVVAAVCAHMLSAGCKGERKELPPPDHEIDCEDELDDDLDGLTDCEDPDCAFRAVCSDCGNGIVEAGEDCDGEDLLSHTCVSQGYSGGVLSCSSQCTLSTYECFYCGDGRCEDDLGEENAICPQDCGDCGNEVVDGDEECDGLDLGTSTCTSLGYTAGMLLCHYDCSYMEDWCMTCGNGVCELGAGETARSCPQDCTRSTRWLEVAVGFSHTCALRNDSTVWCWGYNNSGQLGDGLSHTDCGEDSECSVRPVQVEGLNDAVKIAAGHYFTCAIRNNGTAWCWGSNTHGQLGDGTRETRSTPVQIVGLNGVVDISGGGHGMWGAHACAVLQNGTAWCWGANLSGQLGTDTNGNVSTTPLQVVSTVPFQSISAGKSFYSESTCAIATTGTPWCWGSNEWGRLGIGTTTWEYGALRVANLTTVSYISAGADTACAVDDSGVGWCWGYNSFGELGTGTDVGPDACGDNPARPCSRVPVQVNGITDVVGITPALGNYVCGFDADGQAWCWGIKGLHMGSPDSGDYIEEVFLPRKVLGVQGVQQLGTGQNNGCALTATGKIACWGSNDSGQLGDGTNQSRPGAVLVVDP